MNAEIITIGDEILIGQIVDTNSAWMAHQLNLIGIRIAQITSVSDSKQHILKALDEAISRADIIFITGGLGPTKDDLTKNTLCEYFSTQLRFDPMVFEDIKALFEKLNLAVTELNRQQAEVPESCTPIRNKNGTAPGMWFEKENKTFISMPGVPFEMKAMMENAVIPQLTKNFKLPFIFHKTVLTMGIGESFLADMIKDWENGLALKNIKLAYLPSPGTVKLRLSTFGDNRSLLEQNVKEEIEKLKALIDKYIYGFDDETLEEIIGKMLIEKRKELATAESCTGGYLAHLITSIPGSSKYYKGSVIAYANEIKTNVLKISEKDIAEYGAVSKEVVEQMALAVRTQFNTDYAISTSGIAGPEGGTPEKPVGTVWIAIASDQKVISRKFIFGGNRERNIHIAATTALNMLRKEILAS